MAGIYDKYTEGQQQQPQLNPYLQYVEDEREDIPKGPYAAQRFMFEMMANAPESAIDYFGNYLSVLKDPKGTAEAAAELTQATASKLGRKAAEYETGQEIEPDPERSELFADVAAADIENRYGSWDAFLNTLMNDPVNTLADLSMVGGVIPKVNRVAKYGDLLTTTGRAAQEVAGRAAPGMYKSAASIPESMMGRGDEIARFGLDERIPVSRKGLDIIEARRGEVGEQIGDIIQGKINEWGYTPYGPRLLIPKEEITRPIERFIRRNELILAPEDLAQAQKALDDFNTQFAGKDKLDPMHMQEWKIEKYDRVYGMEASAEPSIAKSGAARGERKMAGGAADALHYRFPEMVGPDAEFSNLSRLKAMLNEVMSSAARPDAGLIEKYIGAPEKLSKVAIGLDRLAKGDLGWVEKNFNTHEIRLLMNISGRLKESTDEQISSVPVWGGKQ